MVTYIAGAPLVALWAWRCPSCHAKRQSESAKKLEAWAALHYEAKHGPLEGQQTIFDELETLHAGSASIETA